MKKPIISIIIPIYNAEKYLEQCLKSVQKQTFENIEIICVDDGSTDSSPAIMDAFKEKDERFVVIHKPNGGNGHSMNAGLAAATGEYIGCVEADDFIEHNMFEKLYQLSQEGKVDIVKGNFWNCYEMPDGSIKRIVNQERANVPDDWEPFTVRECPQILWGHPSIWSGIYKRTLISDNNIVFKEAKGGGWVDNPFFFETMCCAKSIVWTARPFYCYRTEVEGSSSKGYDFNIPFHRMSDNLNVIKKRGYEDEETLKFAYARALMYLKGAILESDYDGREDEFNIEAQKMLALIKPNVIYDDFNLYDQRLYRKYSSPLNALIKNKKKVLIYNWVPFDNPLNAGGGVTVYCRNLIKSIISNRPDVDVYFLSSGWAYDISTNECYIRKTDNIFGEKCKSYEIVNSPVPAPQDMLFGNPEVAFKSEMLTDVFDKFLEKYGNFEVIHFNNMEGLSFDVFDLKKKYEYTKFIFSFHNYVPICMTGFYFDRYNHINCNPNCTPEDCNNCIDRSKMRNFTNEMVQRGKVNNVVKDENDEYKWVDTFEFDRLKIKKDATYFIEFKKRATKALNDNMDCILAVSKRVYDIAAENGINKQLLKVSYIGTRVADFQFSRSMSLVGNYFKICYLGSVLDYEEKGYPFLLEALSNIGKDYASKVDLVLTTTTRDKDDYIRNVLSDFHSIEIIHGYNHNDLNRILKGANLGVIPVLWEDNLPQVAIEMVAFGVPILCSDAGGASELCSSEVFKFKAGNHKDFIKKLTYILDNTDVLGEYWSKHNGLKTNFEHYNEIMDIYNIEPMADISITPKELQEILDERSFLYAHFVEENVEKYRKDNERLRAELRELHSQNDAISWEKNSIKEKANDYAWRLDETRKSKSYKLGMALTAIPRKIRGGSRTE